MNGFYALDVEADLLSSVVGLTCTVQAKFTLPGVKAKKAVRRKGLLFVGLQSENIPIKCGHSPHVFNKEYNNSYIQATALNCITRFERFPLLETTYILTRLCTGCQFFSNCEYPIKSLTLGRTVL